MAITVTLVNDVHFAITTRGHSIESDQPREQGGSDRGMAPIELFIGALGACISYYATVFCKRRGVPTDGLKVELEWEGAEKPYRIGRIQVKVSLPHPLNDRERTGLLRMARGCTLINTMKHPPAVEFTL